jgi:hypothetical protein
MSGKHRMNTDNQMQTADRPTMTRPVVNRLVGKRDTSGEHDGAGVSRVAGFFTSASIAVAFAGFAAAVMVTAADNSGEPQPSAPQTLAAAQQARTPQPLHQQGTVVAISADSITARSADGFVQTYLVTPNTTAVTQNGGETFSAAVPFAVNDEVAIQATVASGTATATAVADRAVIGQDGPPMDSL